MKYNLEGRQVTGDSECGHCIFCNRAVAHLDAGSNPDGLPHIAYFVGAVLNGVPHMFLMCETKWCPEREAASAGDVVTTPERDRVVWRCGCSRDFVENVGDTCASCGASHSAPVPWE